MKYISLMLLALAFVLMCQQPVEAQFKVTNSVFGNGNAVTENENYRIAGTVGQPATGVTMNAANRHFAGFWYVAGTPSFSVDWLTITKIEPSSATVDGGTTITITGTGFQSGATVEIGGKNATDVEVVSATEITAKIPAGSEGTADIVITNPDGKVATLEEGFTYTSSATTTAVTLSITSIEVSPGAKATVQISITDATGLASGDILVKYNADMVTVGGIESTDLISGINLISNKEVPGEIKLSMAGTDGITSGSGALIEIELTVNQDVKPGETTLEFGDTEIYDESGARMPIKLESGTVKIVTLGIKGDVNNDSKVRSNDAFLTLRIAAGLLEPNEHQKWAADVNDDGKIRSNDAFLILRKAAGLAAPDIQSVAAIKRTITLTLPQAHGVAGESITIPLQVDSIDGVASGDICIAYNNKVLRAFDVSSDADALLASNIAEPGTVRITFASSDRLNSKTLAGIRFNILADDVSPLTIQRAELYQENALLVDSKNINGQFASWAIPPEHSALLSNFPNPFNPETWIPYQLAQDAYVIIRIYDGKGQLVRFIDLGVKPAGVYLTKDRTAYWDGRNNQSEKVASGLYFYQLKAGEFSAVRRMVIMK